MIMPDFCSDEWRTHALLLTYTLDPLFFETVALRRLEIGGAHRVLVLADAEASQPRVAEAAHELRRIGRSWAYAPVRAGRSFHPKLVARFGKNDAAVAVLSGNLTPSGWGRNLEVGGHWLAGPGHEDSGGWLARAVASAASWCPGATAQAILDEIKGIPWLRAAADQQAARSPFLAAGSATLFDELRRRCAGRRFSRALIATGSTDADGGLVRELANSFGIEEVEVFVQADRLSFLANKVHDLPLTLWAPPTDRSLHAKVVWLTGPDGDIAVWGSANCSRAAWLLPANLGGNVELAVVDEAPDPARFAGLFDALRGGERIYPLAAEVDSPEDEQAWEQRFGVVEAEFSAPTRWTIRTTNTGQTELTSCVLRVTSDEKLIREIPLITQPGCELVGASELAGNMLPLFAQLTGIANGVPFETLTVPVNERARLLRQQLDADTARRVSAVTPATRLFAKREAILIELAELAMREANEIATAHEVEARRPRDESPDNKAPPPALDPLRMVCQAAAGHAPVHSWGNHRSDASVYFSCFERMLWGAPSVLPDDRAGEEAGGETEVNGGTFAPAIPVADGPVGEQPPLCSDQSDDIIDQKEEDAATLASIRSRLTEWITRLRGSLVLKSPDPPATAYRCGSFIIAVAQAACRARWIPAREAADFAVAVAACFLRQGRTNPGLIADLERICANGPLAESFRTHICNGRLLGAFVNALTAEQPETIAEAIERGSMLARLRKERIFAANIDAGGLEALCSGAPDARHRIMRLALAPAVAAAATELDIAMQGRLPDLRRRIGSGTQLRPDIFWSAAEGWMPARETSVIITPNIGWKTASGDSLIRSKADAVMRAWTADVAPEQLRTMLNLVGAPDMDDNMAAVTN